MVITLNFFLLFILLAFQRQNNYVLATDISNNNDFITEIEKSSISNTIDINILENPSEAELVSNVVCKSSCCYTVTNQLEIVGAVNLVANTDDGCTISAHDDTRIFKIETTGVLTVIHVRINHGRSEKGGALINDGQFHGTNLIFNDNRASIIGGAVYVSNTGIFDCIDCLFLNNNANMVIEGNDKVGASIFGQRYSKVSCTSCHIDNSTESTEKIIEVSKQQQIVFSFDWRELEDL